MSSNPPRDNSSGGNPTSNNGEAGWAPSDKSNRTHIGFSHGVDDHNDISTIGGESIVRTTPPLPQYSSVLGTAGDANSLATPKTPSKEKKKSIVLDHSLANVEDPAPEKPKTIQMTTTLPWKTASTRSTVSSKKKKSVSFAKKVKFRVSLSLEDYSDDEYDACWYSPDEYQAIEKEMCRQFRRMEQGKKLHEKKYCSRGLEKYLMVNGMPKLENQTRACQTVLDEQSRQVISNERDEEAIARLYNNISNSCQMWAAVIGLRDKREAAKYNQDDDDSWDELTQSQEPSIREEYIAPQKSHGSTVRSPMPPVRQTVSARMA